MTEEANGRQSMSELVKFIAMSLVDKPDEVKVEEKEGDKATVIELSVAAEDMGKVIGKQGRIAQAISSLQVFTTGLNVTLGKAELQPGETTTLKITAIKDQIKKAKSMPRVLMITNDPDNPKIVIKVNTKN